MATITPVLVSPILMVDVSMALIMVSLKLGFSGIGVRFSCRFAGF